MREPKVQIGNSCLYSSGTFAVCTAMHFVGRPFTTVRVRPHSGDSQMLARRARRFRAPLWIVAIALLFKLYVIGVPANPSGFCLDEMSVSYNAYKIAHSGSDQFDNRWPLFFRFESEGFNLYGCTFIYLLSMVFFVFGPSILAARLLSSILIFTAALLLGLLANRISHLKIIGVIVALTALWTPWFFDLSRWAHEAALCPLVLAVFLFTLHRVYKSERWSLLDCFTLASILGLLVYGYAIGRMLALLLALGLVLFASDKRHLFSIFKTWAIFSLTLIPLIAFNKTHRGLLLLRFHYLTYIRRNSRLYELAGNFVKHYFANLNPKYLLWLGDADPRRHVPGAPGSILAATLILAVLGIVLILLYQPKDRWWRFILFGTAVSIVPAALTNESFHTLRSIALPVFLLVLTVPSLSWLLNSLSEGENSLPGVVLRRAGVVALLLLAFLQALSLQIRYQRTGAERGPAFEAEFPKVFASAVASRQNPIYLQDQRSATSAYWYGTVQMQDLSQFYQLVLEERAPEGLLVISYDYNCLDCDVVLKGGRYTLYRRAP